MLLSISPPKPAARDRTLPPNRSSIRSSSGTLADSQSSTSWAPRGSGIFPVIVCSSLPSAVPSAACCLVAPISMPI